MYFEWIETTTKLVSRLYPNSFSIRKSDEAMLAALATILQHDLH